MAVKIKNLLEWPALAEDARYPNMINFELNEPQCAPYVFIDNAGNVNIMMPLVSGGHISTDNTCKTHRALKKFWGMGTDGAYASLKRYKEAIQKDLKILPPFSDIFFLKQQRLTQIEHYLNAIDSLESFFRNIVAYGIFSEHPVKISHLINESKALFPILLAPEHREDYPKFKKPVCSFKKALPSWASSLRRALERKGMGYVPIEGQLTKTLLQDFPDIPDEETFARFKSRLSDLCQPLGGISDFSIIKHFDYKQRKTVFVPLTKSFLDNELRLVDECTEPAEQIRMYTKALLNGCLPKLESAGFEKYSALQSNRFGRERLSILVQLLIAHINVDCLQQEIIAPETDFGKIIEADKALGKRFIEAIVTVAAEGKSAERAIFSVLNEEHKAFKLASPLSVEAQERIAAQFKENYTLIDDSDFFDEFLLLGTVSVGGEAGNHQGRICLNFNTVLKAYDKNPLPIPLPKVEKNNFPSLNRAVETTYQFSQADLVTFLQEKRNASEIASVAQFLAQPQTSGNTLFSMLLADTIVQIKATPNWAPLRQALAGITGEEIFQQQKTAITPSYSAKKSAKQKVDRLVDTPTCKMPKMS